MCASLCGCVQVSDVARKCHDAAFAENWAELYAKGVTKKRLKKEMVTNILEGKVCVWVRHM